MTLVELNIPEPIHECLTMISESFKKDYNDLVMKMIYKGLDTLTSNAFEELVPTLVGEVEKYLKAFDEMPE